MSEELILITHNAADQFVQSRVLAGFESQGEFHLLDQETIIEGTSRTYTFLKTLRDCWPEDFKVVINDKEVYLCFYSATNDQKAAVTKLLSACLNEVGIIGTFEEP